MLLIIGAVVFGILLGLALGGSLRALSEATFRFWPLALIGFGLQLIPIPSRPGEIDHWLAVGFLILSYVVLLAFVVLNRRYIGFWLVGLGFLMNVAVIALNAGMPVGDHALRVAYGAGYQDTLHDLVAAGGAKHHLQRPSDKLVLLTDVIPIGTPVHNVFSAGDLVALFGIGWVMAEATKGAPGKHRPRRGGPAELGSGAAVRRGSRGEEAGAISTASSASPPIGPGSRSRSRSTDSGQGSEPSVAPIAAHPPAEASPPAG